MEALATIIRHPGASLRLAVRVLALLLVLAVCVPAHALAGAAGRASSQPSPWPRRFLGLTARILGVRTSSSGRPLIHDVFYVANHIGWIDIPILASLTGTAFVAQDRIRHWPVVGWLAGLNHTVFVSRTERSTVGTQVQQLRAALALRQPIAIFPEGTTTNGRSLLPFKPALFAVLMPPPRRIRIQPVALAFCDCGRDLAWIGEETARENAWRIFTNPQPIHCQLLFLDPFDPADLPDRKAIAAEARRRIAAALAAHYGHPVP